MTFVKIFLIIYLQLFPSSERFNATATWREACYWLRSRDGYSRLHLKFKTCKQTLHLSRTWVEGEIEIRFTRIAKHCVLLRNYISLLLYAGDWKFRSSWLGRKHADPRVSRILQFYRVSCSTYRTARQYVLARSLLEIVKWNRSFIFTFAAPVDVPRRRKTR